MPATWHILRLSTRDVETTMLMARDRMENTYYSQPVKCTNMDKTSYGYNGSLLTSKYTWQVLVP